MMTPALSQDTDAANPSDSELKDPFNLDAEQALLGAILFDNEIYYRVSTFLKPEHFYDPIHQHLYSACDKLITSGRLASPVTLSTYMADNPMVASMAGMIANPALVGGKMVRVGRQKFVQQQDQMMALIANRILIQVTGDNTDAIMAHLESVDFKAMADFGL